MGCQCCSVMDMSIKVNGYDIAPYTERVSVDVTQDLQWEPKTDDKCNILDGEYNYMWGQGRTVIQLTCYPWDCSVPDYTFDLSCPVSVSVSIPWKWVYDCRYTTECYDPQDPKNLLLRKGKWVALPMRKKQITATNDISESKLFSATACSFALPKFDIQAGQRAYVTQFAHQYAQLAYLGSPIKFDTSKNGYYRLSLSTGGNCLGLKDVDVYLTSFQFNFTPPKPPSVQYSFESPRAPCPSCQ